MINLTKVTREYKTFQKKEGAKGAFNAFFKREKIIKTAVSEFELEVKEGEILGLIGPNGAGKTTLIKMMTGIIRPTTGDINVAGYIPHELKNEYKKSFAVVMGQKSQLWWDLPAMDSFKLQRYIYEIEEETFKEKVNYLIDLFEVKDLVYNPVRKLSLGERMKMELIMSLLHSPKILYLDEPTIGLDLITQKNMHQFLKKINEEENVTIILTSHYMNDILNLCHRVVVINDGKKVYDEPIEEIEEKEFTAKIEEIYLSKGEEQWENI